MKKRTPLMRESFSKDATASDVLQFMDDIIPGVAPPPCFVLARNENESQQEFDARRVKDILLNFYEIKREVISSPIMVSADVFRPGVSINFSTPCSVVLSMDFPDSLLDMLEKSQSFGCRISMMGIQIDPEAKFSIPDPVKDLPRLFSGLPGTVSYAPWQLSPLSNPGITIYEAILIAPENLMYHLAADCLARTSEWLQESHGY